jgi:ABC-2 type transport system permease protein
VSTKARMTSGILWVPFLTLYQREWKRFTKVVFQTVFTPLINATLYLLIFGVSLGGSIRLKDGLSYIAFLIPGLVMMSVLNNAFQNTSSSIVSGRFQGDLEDLRVVPLSGTQIMCAMSLAGLARGLLVGAVTLLVGEAFFYTVHGELLAVAHPLALVFFLCLGGLIFACLGIPVAFLAKSFDQVSAFGSFVVLPLIYLGGVFFTIENLHPFWKTISKFNPVLYLINGVRYGLIGHSDVDLMTSALVSLVALAIFYTLGLRALRIGNYSRW